MHKFFASEFFNFETIRILSAAPFAGADVAECLVACSQIRDGDAESWHRAWYVQAEKALRLADAASAAGQRSSARNAYLRASNYFRASAYMFLDLDQHVPEPRIARTSAIVDTVFQKAMDLYDRANVVKFDIPFESGSTLPAYLYTPKTQQQRVQTTVKHPVLVHVGGADSTKEELYYVYAATGHDHGYAVLIFDGPGQGSILRGDTGHVPLHTRPDWENVISHVIESLKGLNEKTPALSLDLDRIAVAGASMGAYYALRCAADPRVQACVALDPFYDMYDFAVDHVGMAFSVLLKAWAAGWIPTTIINRLMNAAMSIDFRTYWEVGIVQWFMGAWSPTKALLQMRRYSFRTADGSNFLSRLRCPVLLSSAGQSLYLQPGTDAKLIYDALDQLDENHKTVWGSTAPEEGGLQAKIGAINLAVQKTFEFLDRHLAKPGAMNRVGSACGSEEFEQISDDN